MYPFKFLGHKIIFRVIDKACETADELLESELFRYFLGRTIEHLQEKQSMLLDIFPRRPVSPDDIALLVETLRYLTKIEGAQVPKIVKGSDVFFRNTHLFNDFVEYLYDSWRDYDRFMICPSEATRSYRRPYRTFNETIEHLTDLVRATYRDIQENITGDHPVVYRQVRAGAEIAMITSDDSGGPVAALYPTLAQIPFIRQILLYPPLILNPPMNKRTGRFVKIDSNPLDVIGIDKEEWICYPAKVGELLILVYIHDKFVELGLSLCNLFELARDEDLKRPPDGVYTFGVPGESLDRLADFPTVFYEDQPHDTLVAAAPNRDEFGYFGYLKKMVLTLHNVKVMQRGALPFHGALVKIFLKNGKEATVLIIGDTGAGKSETLEALRVLGDAHIQDMIIIADDMGSIKMSDDGAVHGYGTEIGAFVRLDDLQPGYAFGQIDRTIIMSPSQVNARAVLPVTTYANVVRGYSIDFVLYANNYELIDEDHPVLESFSSRDEALRVFREGTVMSKGTTTSTGLVHSYFANIFGPPQYKGLHDRLAQQYFTAFFERGMFVGQLRTRLGIPGWEAKGPEAAALELLAAIENR